MLEAIRRLGVERRWVFGLVLGIVTVTFVGTMGWVGLSGPSGAYAAKVNGDPVLLTEWEEQYKRSYRQYQNQLGDQFTPELMQSLNLKMQVLVALIDRKLWLALGRDTGLTVSDAEVRKALMDIPAFQSNGRFSSRIYLEVLNRIRTTPEAFEAGIREDLLSAKIQSLIASAARLTDADRADLASQEPGDEGRQADQAAGLLNRKRSQLVLAYATRMREQAKIRIFRENLDLQSRPG
jgi:peptidyl-prolyl cis-trans isomerase D